MNKVTIEHAAIEMLLEVCGYSAVVTYKSNGVCTTYTRGIPVADQQKKRKDGTK